MLHSIEMGEISGGRSTVAGGTGSILLELVRISSGVNHVPHLIHPMGLQKETVLPVRCIHNRHAWVVPLIENGADGGGGVHCSEGEVSEEA